MRRLRRALPRAAAGVALALVPGGLTPAGADDTGCPGGAQGFQRLKTAEAEIAFRWEPAELRVGEFFAADVVACHARGAEPVGQIVLDATMPAHGHGMSYRPKVEPAGPGRFRITGLLLHMPGTWHLAFDLLQGGRRTRLTHEVDVRR